MGKVTKIGIIGCGNISEIYLKNITMMDNIEVSAVSDLFIEKAKERAAQYDIPKAVSVEELLADPEIEVILNLTIPKAHAEVSLQVLNAGKHVYSEKPLAITLDEGRKVLDTAKSKGLRVGVAPDTFLGGGIQTCKKLVEEGEIGEPIAATAFMMKHGPESWHPNPEFFYEKGAGPMFDMGPYYLSALINLIGPIHRVTGSARASFKERTITSEAKYGQKIKVDTPTHIAGVLDFQNGAIGTIITSFDVWGSQTPRIEIYGTEATLSVPDPNTFGGPVLIKKSGEDWKEVPITEGYTENSRGIGLMDMVNSISAGVPHKASGDLGFHVLETMYAIHAASLRDRHYFMTSIFNPEEANYLI